MWGRQRTYPWTLVEASRRRRRRQLSAPSNVIIVDNPSPNQPPEEIRRRDEDLRWDHRRPRSTAIAIRPTAKGQSHGEIIRARNDVSLEELDISDIHIRRTANGNLLEVAGPECDTKTDKLAERLKGITKK